MVPYQQNSLKIGDNGHQYANNKNLKIFKVKDSKMGCIEVYQHLYSTLHVLRNEVSVFIAPSAWAELKLNERVDWLTIIENYSNKVLVLNPTNEFISYKLRWRDGG